MAKKQLKKVNQPKKYLQGGSNMGSVAQMKQTPYYLGQVEAGAAEDRLDASTNALARTRMQELENKRIAEEQVKQQNEQFAKNTAQSLLDAGIKDSRTGDLGRFFRRGTPEITPGVTKMTEVAATNALPYAYNTGAVVAPTASTAGLQTVSAAASPATQMVVGQAAPTMSTVGQTVTGSANVADVGTAASAATRAGLSGLATAGIGAALTGAGMITERKTDDRTDFYNNQRERRGNVAAESFKAAGLITPLALNPAVLAATSGLSAAAIPIAAGIGALKGRKENKANTELAQNLQRESAAQRGAYQSAFINSRLGTLNQGFGYASNNVGNSATTQYQVARDGGVTGIQGDRRPKKVPGGEIVPIEGTDAVEFVGRTHAQGGIIIEEDNNGNPLVEVEGGGKKGQGETMDQVAMNDNNKQDYIFSRYLKIGGKSFAQRHKEILKGNGSQAEIQQLAAMQEKVAGRNPQQVAAYGGFHKYATGGTPCPDCPPGTICDPATGNCVADEDTPSSYDWQATGLEGFKAGQNAKPVPYATPNKSTASKADMNDAWKMYMANKKAEEIAAQNGTANAPADAVATGKSKGWGAAGAPSSQVDVDQPTYTEPAGVKPPENKTPKITDAEKKQAMDQLATLDADWAAGKISSKDEYNAKRIELFNSPAFNAAIDDRNSGLNPTPYNSSSANAATTPDNTSNQPIDQEEQDWRNYWISQGYVFNAAGERELPPGKKLVVYDDGSEEIVDDPQTASTAAAYTAPTGITPPAASSTPPAATQTNTGTPTPPPAATADDGFVAPAKRATSTGAAAGTPQTPEEKEAARLAGLPRLFMGASRKVDETTGEVTAYTDKPLMGVGAMAGSRLGTATGSQEDLAKVTRNSYDQAWSNKADNLYTNQKDASGGGLSSSDAIKDRDKIAESNWGQKYGYKKGMSADEAKAAHGKFAEDVKSLFANNPDEMMGYFQYIIDGGVYNPKAPGTYLGKDAEQIRNNLKTKGYIDANGQPIAGKVVAGKTMAQYLEDQATNNAVGPIHNALGSYTAERSSARIKLEEQKKKEVETPAQELPKTFEPCPPGNYRSQDGSCQPVPPFKQKDGISGSMLAGFGQLIPMGAALLNPYKISPGIAGAPAIKGPLLYRNNMNQDRATAIQNNVAMKNAVVNQNAGPGALAVLAGANTALNSQMLKIAQQEQDANKQLAAEEGKLGMQASMFNAETAMKRQMFNAELSKDERRYGREDMLGALSGAARGVAGIVRDEKLYAAQERLARTDETGSYDRFATLEQLQKEAKRKGSPFYGKTEAELRRIASAMYKELNPEGYVGLAEYKKLQEEKAKLEKEKAEAEKQGKAKFGGARQYVSRLGQLNGVRSTKAKL